MKALGYAAPSAGQDLAHFHFERRAPRDEDVTIEILYCGVCHSDLHLARDHGGFTTFLSYRAMKSSGASPPSAAPSRALTWRSCWRGLHGRFLRNLRQLRPRS
jgi:hypothetical protein